MTLRETISRRGFLQTSSFITAGVASGLGSATGFAAESGSSRRPALIDTNITLSRWPFRRLPLDETPALVARLRHQGVTHAWAGSFDGLLHKDMAAVNARLADECRKHGRGLLLPFGSINPKLPDWEEELRRCHEQHQMPGIRLHPNYQGYKLEDPILAKLLDRASERGLIIQLAVMMEDERSQHPLMQVPHVDAAPLLELLKTRPKLRLVLLNWFRALKGEPLQSLAHTGQVFFDIATLEGVGGVGDLFQQVPPDSVVFGSHAPFFYFESALFKLKESQLTATQAAGIRAVNAGLLLRHPKQS